MKRCGELLFCEEAAYIIRNVEEVVTYLWSFSPVWRDLITGKRTFILP